MVAHHLQPEYVTDDGITAMPPVYVWHDGEAFVKIYLAAQGQRDRKEPMILLMTCVGNATRVSPLTAHSARLLVEQIEYLLAAPAPPPPGEYASGDLSDKETL